MNIHHKVILTGGHAENDSQRILRAGSLSLIFENGSLRHISSGGTELIRMVYMAVRNRDWLTAIPVINDEKINFSKYGFSIGYSARYLLGDIDFRAVFSINGFEDNRIEISFTGEALSSFEKNRIGFCVLHPVDNLAGNICTIIHSGGQEENSLFPLFVSPHQPFRDISGMKWTCDGNSCSMEFHGDIFETEDQRNWTDASYKTYSTPLSLPFPVKVEKGWKTSQKIIFKAETNKTKPVSARKLDVEIYRSGPKPMPAIGICRSTRPQPLTEDEIQILGKIRFSHYRTELYLFDPAWKHHAELSLSEAKKLNYALAPAMFFSGEIKKETDQIISWLKDLEHPVASVLIFHKDYKYTPDDLVNYVAPLVKDVLPGTAVISGTNANFAQLNRNRPKTQYSDGVCWSVHPQEHASDILTLTENLRGQYETVVSARQFCKSGKLWVSPVNLVRRFNANRENFETPSRGKSIPAQVDTRIMSLFGAGWASGSLKYLSDAGVDAITFFETSGERGIIQGDYDPAWKEFPAMRGIIFPVYHVFRFLSDKKISGVISSSSSDPLVAESFIFTDGRKKFGIFSNLTGSEEELNIIGGSSTYRVKILDSREYQRAAVNPDWLSGNWTINNGKKIKLTAYSLIFVEF